MSDPRDTLTELEPEVRRSLIDGLTRFGPLPLLLGTTLVSAWVMDFGASSFLAGVVCVFEMPRAIQTHPDGCVSTRYARGGPDRRAPELPGSLPSRTPKPPRRNRTAPLPPA